MSRWLSDYLIAKLTGFGLLSSACKTDKLLLNEQKDLDSLVFQVSAANETVYNEHLIAGLSVHAAIKLASLEFYKRSLVLFCQNMMLHVFLVVTCGFYA